MRQLAAEDGDLRTTPGKGQEVYLLTRDSFGDFDLSFERNGEPECNSGIKHRFRGYWAGGNLRQSPEGPTRIEPVALEYQIADDERNPVLVGLRIEHWLDGRKVVDVTLDDPAVQEAFRKSSRKGSSPALAKQERRSSPIAVQTHDGVARFRNLVIRTETR